MIRSRSSRQIESIHQVHEQARSISVLVAYGALRMISTGNWSTSHPLAADVVTTARSVLSLGEQLGPVCDADLLETVVEQMASAAHQIMLAARGAIADGQAAIGCEADIVVIHPDAEALLIPAYSLLAIG